MGKIEFRSVDQYIASQPETARNVLQQVRSIIRKAIPAVEEVISYQMPTYTLHGRRLLFFAGWKDHYSLYAATGEVLAAFKKELARYEIEKGTIRFPFAEPVPVKLIREIARFRVKEFTEHDKTNTGAAKSRPGAVKRA
jgi:uncharacterized protein YdhG (YjbR/CyaY superfamily)